MRKPRAEAMGDALTQVSYCLDYLSIDSHNMTEAFIDWVSECGSVAAAAHYAGVDVRYMHDLLNRMKAGKEIRVSTFRKIIGPAIERLRKEEGVAS